MSLERIPGDVERIQSALGLTTAELQTHTVDEIAQVEATTGRTFPDELRFLFTEVGSGWVAFFEIFPPQLAARVTADYERTMTIYEEAGNFDDDPDLIGDPAAPGAVAFAGDSSSALLYESGARRAGRIVSFTGNHPGLRMNWTAAASLSDYFRCIAELCEAGAFIADTTIDPIDPMPPDVAYTGPEWWNPDPYRDILDRNNCTGAVYLSTDFN